MTQHRRPMHRRLRPALTTSPPTTCSTATTSAWSAAPIGGCILYALSCNLSDSALVNQHDLLTQAGKRGAGDEVEEEEEEGGPEEAEETGGGAKVKLKPWNRRQGRNLGLDGQGGRPAPRSSTRCTSSCTSGAQGTRSR